MEPTAEDLAHAVFCLGKEETQTEEIPTPVLKRLAECDLVHVEVDSPPELTGLGREAYDLIASLNDGEGPDFDDRFECTEE